MPKQKGLRRRTECVRKKPLRNEHLVGKFEMDDDGNEKEHENKRILCTRQTCTA